MYKRKFKKVRTLFLSFFHAKSPAIINAGRHAATPETEFIMRLLGFRGKAT